jgi:GDPmannose 4,6-dehydratase
MYKILQHDTPDDFVLATGESHSNREFIEEACKYIDVELQWVGEGIEEKGIDIKSNKIVIEIDQRYFRPCEVELLLGNSEKAKRILGWEAKTTFKDLVKLMMEDDLRRINI